MDLPTCPSCGQSVLDDDAAICPFCGAAMDGSAVGKQTAAPAASKGKPTKPADSGDDDPFAVERAPAAAKVIPCARKPMKGRMHRVICPMCDCQGFIPKGAIGRQVKCPNKECLVPVFTAEGDGGETPTRAPGRVSDDAVAREVKVSTEGGKKNPMVIYGIVGVVALAATIGLVKYLNSMGTNELPPLPPVPGAGGSVAGTDTPDEPDPVTPVEDPDEPVAEPVPEYRQKALELLVEMIDTSRVTPANRDKAYCRRMTADAYLRLGMMDEAAEQFESLDRLATDRRSRKGYYKMVPLLNRYWRLIAAGEDDKAASVLDTASELRTQMPSSGEVALESGIMLAAAVVHSGDMQLAAEIVKTVQNIEDNPGLLTLHDFADYAAKERDPVCGPYRSYIVCSVGEPSSGGLTLLQMLGLLEGFDLKALGPSNPRSWHLIAQASALAFADRNLYMADPDFVNTPGVALLNPEYLQSRGALMDAEKPLQAIEAGLPAGWEGPLYERGVEIAKPGTSHISVIDSNGNIASMTTTIEGAFGSHVMVEGFLLNNQLTDFSFVPIDGQQKLVANMAEGGKRPRSSMAPTIVFDSAGKPVLVLGSAGGSRIIGYVLEQIIAALDWQMPIEEALAMKHTLARGALIETEDESLKAGLAAMENQVEIKDLNSGLTAIQIRNNSLYGAADPRREGLALGK